MKSEIYVLIPWPDCQKLTGIPEVDEKSIWTSGDQPQLMIPIQVACDYLDGEVINGEFIWNDPLPEDERYLVDISIFNTGILIKCENKDIITRTSITIQEMFNVATYVDERGWLHADKVIPQDELTRMYKEMFNIGALNLKFKTE